MKLYMEILLDLERFLLNDLSHLKDLYGELPYFVTVLNRYCFFIVGGFKAIIEG